MASPTFFDRITSPKVSSPILPLHSPRKKPSEYSLSELDPQPENPFFDQDIPQERMRKTSNESRRRAASPESVSWSWNEQDTSSVGSQSKKKRDPRTMFAGPPPPIASSIMMQNGANRPPGRQGNRVQIVEDRSPSRGGFVEASRAQINSVLFDPRPERSVRTPRPADTVWNALSRRQKAIEREVQQLLDLQASGLLAGAGGLGGAPSESEVDVYSDTGSSTPTGTFYSTATSKSRIRQSLYLPTKATSDGNIVPVRQPAKAKPARGLKAIRNSIRKALDAFEELKMEEDEHLDEALSQRKKALSRGNRINHRIDNVSDELKSLEDDPEEPLGREYKQLSVKYDTVSQEIRELEEKLVGMRNRKRSIKEKMEHVKNRREAGLSGYRGALKEANAEMVNLLQRPPFLPLEPEALGEKYGGKTNDYTLPGGAEFMKLIPQRRTYELAKTWWEGEVALLEKRKKQVQLEREGLGEGGIVWRQVMSLVSEFESSLRAIVKASMSSPPPVPASVKGKEIETPDPIKEQLPRMNQVVQELEEKMLIAEENGWNLLICAIGAELEAFQEAQDALGDLFQTPITSQETGDEHEQQPPDFLAVDDSQPDHPPSNDEHPLAQPHSQTEESDNDIPPDLLVSHPEESEPISDLQRTGTESSNDVPPEFLFEHDGHDPLD